MLNRLAVPSRTTVKLALSCLLGIVSVAFVHAEDRAAAATEFLKKAAEAGNFLAPKEQLTLTYKTTFHQMADGRTDFVGRLIIHADASGNSRLRIVSPGYAYTLWRTPANHFAEIPSRYLPLPQRQLESLLNNFVEPSIGDKLKAGKVRKSEVFGRQALCLEARKGRYRKKVCVDPATYALLTIIEDWGVGDIARYEYKDFKSAGGRLIPGRFTFVDQLGAAVEGELLEVESPARINPELLKPTNGARPRRDRQKCLDGSAMTSPKPIKTPNPEFTQEARTRGVQGKVTIIGIVGLDGRFHDAEVLETADAGLNEAAMEVITQRWLFEPAKCGGQPVETEITVEVMFRLYAQ